MYRLISILVLVGFLFQSFSQLLIVTSYLINEEYVANNLCVNRNTPEMDCKGKCQLEKELKKQEEKNDVPASPKIEKNEVLFLNHEKINQLVLIEEPVVSFFEYVNHYSTKITFPVFHPPGC